MEQYENPLQLNSISAIVIIQNMNFSKENLSKLSSVLSDPLFSSIVALYTLILLYVPHLFLRVLCSPVLFLTGILLLTLLRLGSNQKSRHEISEKKDETEREEIVENPGCKEESFAQDEEDHKWVACKFTESSETEMGFEFNRRFEDSFVEWDVKAPLEVIYEEYEGEDGDDSNRNSSENKEGRFAGIERYPSLSQYYPESDSESSSDEEYPVIGNWESPESLCFRWEEDDREGLIEISLDSKKNSDFQVEEENMIEIDISPTRSGDWY